MTALETLYPGLLPKARNRRYATERARGRRHLPPECAQPISETQRLAEYAFRVGLGKLLKRSHFKDDRELPEMVWVAGLPNYGRCLLDQKLCLIDAPTHGMNRLEIVRTILHELNHSAGEMDEVICEEFAKSFASDIIKVFDHLNYGPLPLIDHPSHPNMIHRTREWVYRLPAESRAPDIVKVFDDHNYRPLVVNHPLHPNVIRHARERAPFPRFVGVCP